MTPRADVRPPFRTFTAWIGGPLSILAVCATGTAALAQAEPDAAQPASPASGLPPRTKTALKIAGLVAFVTKSCPQLKTDGARFRSMLAALGVTEQDLAKPDMKAIYVAYATQYQKNAAASCDRARLQFGPKGATVSDLFGSQ